MFIDYAHIIVLEQVTLRFRLLFTPQRKGPQVGACVFVSGMRLERVFRGDCPCAGRRVAAVGHDRYIKRID